jgi:hypothetical protein
MNVVVNIGDFRLTRTGVGTTRAADGECKHNHLVYDENGRILTCEDCKKQIDPFWAMLHQNRYYAEQMDYVEREKKQLALDIQKGVVLRAAQKVEEAWRRRKMMPTCPHCWKGILPTDRFGSSGISPDYAAMQGYEPKPLILLPLPRLVEDGEESA